MVKWLMHFMITKTPLCYVFRYHEFKTEKLNLDGKVHFRKAKQLELPIIEKHFMESILGVCNLRYDNSKKKNFF